MRGAVKVRWSGARRAWPALLVALSILLQGLIPAAALAADHTDGSGVQICTLQGVKTLSGEAGGHKHFGGLACEQCVMASFAAVAAVQPVLPQSHAVARAEAPLAVARTANRPRDPPRPPSQGPPSFS